MIVLTEEFKRELIAEIKHDAAFGFDVYYALLGSVNGDALTKTYLDEALAKQSRNFDAKLEELAREFDAKLLAQSLDLKQYVEAQAQDIKTSLKQYFDAKLGKIGSRWGVDAEYAIREFFTKMAANWGGTVEKWRRKVRLTGPEGYVYQKTYEIDMVISNGKRFLVEVKAHSDVEDLERFLENVRFYEYSEGKDHAVKKILLTFSVDDRVVELAANAGIEVINGLE